MLMTSMSINSIIDFNFFNQFSLPDDEDARNQPTDTTSYELDWSRNNYLASESTESLEKLGINHPSQQ